MQIKDLRPNKKNPRKITDKKLASLKKSLEKYGDLSGFVYNRRTKTLVSGHQKQKSIPPNSPVKIELKYEIPTSAYTVAEGYVLIGEERFKYREVDADDLWEAEAILAANKQGGDWDREKLKIFIADFPSIDIEATGFDLPELKMMDITFDNPVVEQSDEEYLEENPGPDSSISKENISMANPVESFNAVEENTESKLTRNLVIIDCPSVEVKDSIKEKLRTDKFGEQYGVKIF